MPLESGGRQKILSGEAPHLQDDGSRNPVQTDSMDMHPDLNLGAGREDINLGQNGQPQEQAYNSEERRDVYQNQEESFDEQRQNYTEKAFNSYDYETFIEQVTVTNEFRRAGSAHTGDRLTSPPAIPSANPDSELELSEWAQEMMDRNGKHISLLKQDKSENNRQRERLKKKQPSVKKYSIKEGRKVEKKLNEREYGRQRSKENRESERREQRIAAAKRTGRLLFNDENIEEDEDSAAIKHAVHKGAYIAKRRIRKNMRDISDKSYVYKRLKFKDKKDRLADREGQRLKHEQGRILAVNRKMSELDKMSATSAVIKTAPETGRQETANKKEAARRAENRKIQQQKKQRERIACQQERIQAQSQIVQVQVH